MRTISALLAATGLLACAGVARAQYFNPGLISGVMGPVVTNPCPLGTTCGGGAVRARGAAVRSVVGGGFPRGADATPGPLKTGYRPDPEISARTRRQFLDFVRRSAGARGADAVARNWAQLPPDQAWARFAAPDGLRLGDVADAMTEYWVLNWMIANRVENTPASAVQAARRQVRAVLARDPTFARLGDAGRQEMAEVLIYNTMLQGQVYKEAVTARDDGLLHRLGDAASARFQNEASLDPRGLVLTDRGFVQRG